MTDNTQELEQILDKYAEHYFDQLEGFGGMHTINKTEAKQALLNWHNKQVLEVIGEDEQANLREISRDVDMDSALALREYRLARNDLRAEQRNKLKEAR